MFVRNIIIIFDKLQPMVFIYSYYILKSDFYNRLIENIFNWKEIIIGRKYFI